jgi:hypothetical protein
MSAENPIEQAEQFVRQNETNYKATRVALGKVLSKMGKTDEVQAELNALTEENRRLVPPGYDEEEWRLGNLAKKK